MKVLTGSQCKALRTNVMCYSPQVPACVCQNPQTLVQKKTVTIKSKDIQVFRPFHRGPWVPSYLLQCFKQQNVSAGVLKSATLLVCFWMNDPRLRVIVLIVIRVVRLCTDCSRTNRFRC